MLSLSKHLAVIVLAAVGAFNATVYAETETIDLKSLAKKARPAVMLLVVSDANGKEIATGTGFLVSSDGKLITNHHVIENAASVVAKAENGGLFTIEGVLADDPTNDLALLKLKGKDLPFLPLGNSEKIEVGTRIAVVGSTHGLEGSLSEGLVSALNFAVPVACGIRLMAKVKPSSVPQPLNQSANAGGEDAIFSDPDWRAACAAEASGDNVEDLKRSKVLVVRYPDNAVAWCGLGIVYDRLNFADDAIVAFRQAIKLKPDDADAWYGLGVCYGRAGRTDDAIAACRQTIKLKPDYAEAWNRLGTAYGIAGRANDAIAAFRQTIKLKPDSAEAWYLLGAVYVKAGHTDNAIAAFRQAIKLKPDYAEAWYLLGTVYGDAERTNDARDAFERAKKLDPESFK
jgi:cytochrome c-type biogenesis protein CcmH/NrfG